MTTKSKLEQELLEFLIDQGIPPTATNMPISQDRGWICDMVWWAQRIALEVEGGTFSGGRHTRGKGYAQDCEKYNALQLNGWIVLRYTTTHLSKSKRHCVADDVRAALRQRGGFPKVEIPGQTPKAQGKAEEKPS
jgi:hypothetical protein